MSQPNKQPAPEMNWAGEIELTAVNFERAINNKAENRIVVGSVTSGVAGYEGRVKQIVQLRNGNIRAAIEPNSTIPGVATAPKLRYLILTPPYRADVKE